MEYKDYYDILGLKRDASKKDIKKAFRSLARKFHPDVSKAKGAAAKFKEVSEAYEVLKDEKKRELYDSLGANWQQGQNFRPPPGFENMSFDFGQGGSGTDFSDFFSSIFAGGQSRRPRRGGGFSGVPGFEGFEGFEGFGGGCQRPQRPSKPPSEEVELEVSLEDVYHGVTKKVALQGPRGSEILDVTIPAGISDGGKIRLGGAGASAYGGVRGDLIVKLRIAKHRHYVVDKFDLVIEVPIAPWEAVLGGKVEVPTLDGSINLSVPAQSQSGKRLRLSGKGLRKRGGERGSLYVVLRVVVPDEISDEERALFQKLSDCSSFDPRRW